jgi:putative transposase
MISKPVAFLLADLGITKTHGRPHVSTDTPYSEAQCKTFKDRPEFPERFGSIEHARALSRDLFQWYHHEHHHSALGLLTPADVHYGRAAAKIAQRAGILAQAYERHPERFVRGVPQPPALPTAVWINQPPTGLTAPPIGAALENDALRCPRSDDRHPGRESSTLDSGALEPAVVVQ